MIPHGLNNQRTVLNIIIVICCSDAMELTHTLIVLCVTYMYARLSHVITATAIYTCLHTYLSVTLVY